MPLKSQKTLQLLKITGFLTQINKIDYRSVKDEYLTNRKQQNINK